MKDLKIGKEGERYSISISFSLSLSLSDLYLWSIVRFTHLCPPPPLKKNLDIPFPFSETRDGRTHESNENWGIRWERGINIPQIDFPLFSFVPSSKVVHYNLMRTRNHSLKLGYNDNYRSWLILIYINYFPN